MTAITFNQVPHNIEAEQSVIGSLLIDPQGDNCQQVIVNLSPDVFYQRAHRIIFEKIKTLNSQGLPIDIITVTSELEKSGDINTAGGFAYLAEITHRTPSAANINAYARMVRDKAVERLAINKTAEIQRLFTTPGNIGLDEKINIAQMLFTQFIDNSKNNGKSGLTNISDILIDWFNDVDDRFNHPDKHTGLKTGMNSLDEMLAPKYIVKGSLFVIGARPKMGKTTVLTELAKNVSRNGLPVALFSMEMTNNQMAERMISQQSGVDTSTLYGGTNDEYEWHLIGKAIHDLKDENNIWVDDTPGMTLSHIQSECRKLKQKVGEIGFIGIDYLTLMKAGKAERNDLAFGQITKGLKQLAKELNTVVVLLTQLNRKLEDRTNKRPMPSDSRDTGQIEQDCDYWLGVYRDSVYNENSDKTLTELIMRLNRHGNTGTVYVKQRGLTLFSTGQPNAVEKTKNYHYPAPSPKNF
ncbi:replicative DNA helicase [Arsenophonus sp.]|uniref:replicative DNA helicase n=1 Tax=Arsenophonus sp. TaxID=1872640 RepID=UPI003879BE29